MWNLTLRSVIICTVGLLGVLRTAECAVIMGSDGQYSGITVAISPQLTEEECGATVSAIKDVFKDASVALHKATSSLTFGSIAVVVPESWTSCGPFTISKTDGLLYWNNSDFRVGPSHPIFGDKPWTKQPRGCGMSGDYVYLPREWLYLTSKQRGSRILHEWAKYRWGVFEEYGHYMDAIYPESYIDDTGSWVPNYCSNEPLQAHFQTDCSTSSSDCEVEALSTNDNVFSSIMAIPELSQVSKFCDERTHKKNVPSKQNSICGRQSAEAVIAAHSDAALMKIISSASGPAFNNVTVTVVKESKTPSVVIAFETSAFMDDIPNEFEYEKETISQFIVYEAPSIAKIGLVTFGSYVKILNNVIRLDPSSRVILSEAILKTTTEGENVNLYNAVAVAAKTLGKGNGVILLLTKCTTVKPSHSAEELVRAAEGHPVWVLLYPYVKDTYLKTYSDLAFLTGGQLLIVEQEIIEEGGGNRLMSPTVRMQLSQAFRQILHLDFTYDIRQISYETCSEKTCKLNLRINDGYEAATKLYLYYSSTDIVADVTYIEGGSCIKENYGTAENAIQTTTVLKCQLYETAEKLRFTVERKLAYGDLIAELTGHPKLDDTGYDFRVYASRNIYDLRYTATSAPAIFVELFYMGKSVLHANITITIPSGLSSQLLYLRDDGTGADITGNDGVYSTYLLPVLPFGKFDFNVSANDNNGKAQLLLTVYHAGHRVLCCGSSLPLPDSLDSTPSFNLSREGVSGRVTASSNAINLPPGQIKDLSITLEDKSVHDVRNIVMSFTATGADLDYGTASWYVLTTNNGNKGASQELTLEVAPKVSGSVESMVMDLEECDISYSLTIVAVDELGQFGTDSNIATIYVPCEQKGNLSSGAIVGIVIAFFVLVLMIILIIYFLLRNKYSKNETKGGPLMLRNYSCCHDTIDEATYSEPSNPATTLNAEQPTVEQIRTIQDLDLRSTMISELQLQQEKRLTRADGNSLEEAEDSSETESQSHANDHNTQQFHNEYQPRSYSQNSLIDIPVCPDCYGSKSSMQSSASTSHSQHSTIPINQVGIPIAEPFRTYEERGLYQRQRSAENLLKAPPPVPPKPFVRNLQV